MNSEKFTKSEHMLFDRFASYDENALPSVVRGVFDAYKDNLFMHDIFSIIVEDVSLVLSIDDWNEASYKKLIFTAKQIYDTTDCFFPANEHFLFALSIVWISYCCKYKDNKHIIDTPQSLKSRINDSIHLEYSLCAQFFNYFAGPTVNKSKKFEAYMFKTHGKLYRDVSRNNDRTKNFSTLLYLLELMNFKYEPLKAEPSLTHPLIDS